MGILNYIKEKKQQFQAAQDVRATQRQEKQRLELEQVKEERVKLEERNKTVRELMAEKNVVKELKKEQFNNSPIGSALAFNKKIVTGTLSSLQKVAKESKARGSKNTRYGTRQERTSSGFGFGNTAGFGNNSVTKTNNVFGASFGNEQNAPRIKTTKKDKGLTININR